MPGYGNTGSIVGGARNRGGNPRGGTPFQNWLQGPDSFYGRNFGVPGHLAGEGNNPNYGDPRRGLPGYPAGTGVRGRPPLMEGDRRMGEPYNYPPQGPTIMDMYQDQVGRRQKEWAGIRGDVLGEYDDLIGEVRGLGEQERVDINSGFNRMESRNQSDLTSRGLGSTTMLQGARSGNERARADAVGGLEDRLRRNLIGIQGDRTSALERLGIGGYTAGRTDDMGLLGAEMQGFNQNNQNIMNLISQGQGMGQGQIGQDQQLMQYIVSLMTGRQDQPLGGNLGQALAIYGNLNPPYVSGGGRISPSAAAGAAGFGSLGGFANQWALNSLGG